jgi:hypothetical protein
MNPSVPGTILLVLGLALFVGYFAKLLVNRFRIPDVTGYVALGVGAGFLFFQRSPGLLDSMAIISDLALAIIAFIVGHELRRDVIMTLGKAIFCIAFLEAFCAAILVFCVVYFTGLVPLHTALILGAIASATAGIRRPGSAALDLAWLAAGRMDGFFELGLSEWDIAAGALLVTEAGGLISDLTGGHRYMESGNVVAGGPKVFKGLLQKIQPHVTEGLKK